MNTVTQFIRLRLENKEVASDVAGEAATLIEASFVDGVYPNGAALETLLVNFASIYHIEASTALEILGTWLV